MYRNAREKKNGEESARMSNSFALELTRSSAEVEDFELRHEKFLQNITESDEEGPSVVATIQSIAMQHQRVGKRDFSETSHFKRFRPTNDNQCINVRDDQISKYPNGDTYDGQFLNIDTLRSTATSSAEHSSSGEGEGDEGGRGPCTQTTQLKHGRGKFKYVNGDSYEGDWSYDKW